MKLRSANKKKHVQNPNQSPILVPIEVDFDTQVPQSQPLNSLQENIKRQIYEAIDCALEENQILKQRKEQLQRQLIVRLKIIQYCQCHIKLSQKQQKEQNSELKKEVTQMQDEKEQKFKKFDQICKNVKRKRKSGTQRRYSVQKQKYAFLI